MKVPAGTPGTLRTPAVPARRGTAKYPSGNSLFQPYLPVPTRTLQDLHPPATKAFRTKRTAGASSALLRVPARLRAERYRAQPEASGTGLSFGRRGAAPAAAPRSSERVPLAAPGRAAQPRRRARGSRLAAAIPTSEPISR